jgi:membrane-bound lytic murein transglycosylase B
MRTARSTPPSARPALSIMRLKAAWVAIALAGVAVLASAAFPQSAPAFRAFLERIRPEAEARGVSRATFEAATADLTPDLSLPDLITPGREQARSEQAEFVQTPAQYLAERTLQNLATRGRRLLEQHRVILTGIEERFGVPPPVLLATQAYTGRRRERFREEFVLALKLIEEGRLRPARRKSSWAGAMGLVQFLPSDLYRYGVDADRDGDVDIWTSVPDALASAANQLKEKGWRSGIRWGHEVRAPRGLDCTIAEPDFKLPVREWLARGFVPAKSSIAPSDLAEEASLILPAGNDGPAFLLTRNYFVLKDYNFSDLYVLFLGNLSDRITGETAFATPWPRVAQASAREIEAMQRRLTELGFYSDRIDGKAGMATRVALGRFQKSEGVAVDCWPGEVALETLRRPR